MNPDDSLFSILGLTVLNRQVYDPTAKGSYEVLSGGLVWPDELPAPGKQEREWLSLQRVFRYLVAYRAALTLGEDRAEFRPV